MSQPVKLSTGLVLDARLIAEESERSIASQIEFWAQIGRAIEPLLRGDRVLALKRAGSVKPLAELITTVEGAPGRRRLERYLASRPFPHYEPCGDDPALLVRVDEDGSRTRGRFVNRVFEPAE